MYAFVPNYTRIRAHKHVPQMGSLGVHGTGGALRELTPKMEAALPLNNNNNNNNNISLIFNIINLFQSVSFQY